MKSKCQYLNIACVAAVVSGLFGMSTLTFAVESSEDFREKVSRKKQDTHENKTVQRFQIDAISSLSPYENYNFYVIFERYLKNDNALIEQLERQRKIELKPLRKQLKKLMTGDNAEDAAVFSDDLSDEKVAEIVAIKSQMKEVRKKYRQAGLKNILKLREKYLTKQRKWLLKAGLNVVSIDMAKNAVVVAGTVDNVTALASSALVNDVQFLPTATPMLTNVLHERGFDQWWDFETPYTGVGVNVGIRDVSFYMDHNAFSHVNYVTSSTATQVHEASSTESHGTHVLSTILGANFTVWSQSKAVPTQGGSPGATNAYLTTLAETNYLTFFLDPDETTASLDVINNSWGHTYGSAGSGPSYVPYRFDEEYNAQDRDWDKLVIDTEATIVFAAGNQGAWEFSHSTVNHPARSMNVITVGMLYPYYLQTTDDYKIDRNSGSGADPVNEDNPFKPNFNRKPDLVTVGQVLAACAGAVSCSKTLEGTSMAAPQVTAAAALLTQAGVSSPTAIKAVLINSADTISSNGTNYDEDDDFRIADSRWDRRYGWGYLNMATALEDRHYVHEDVSINDQTEAGSSSHKWAVTLEPGEKVTIAWLAQWQSVSSIHPLQNRDIDIALYDAHDMRLIDSDTADLVNVHQVGNTTGATIDAIVEVVSITSSEMHYSIAASAAITRLTQEIVAPTLSGYSPAMYTGQCDGQWCIARIDTLTLENQTDIDFEQLTLALDTNSCLRPSQTQTPFDLLAGEVRVVSGFYYEYFSGCQTSAALSATYTALGALESANLVSLMPPATEAFSSEYATVSILVGVNNTSLQLIDHNRWQGTLQQISPTDTFFVALNGDVYGANSSQDTLVVGGDPLSVVTNGQYILTFNDLTHAYALTLLYRAPTANAGNDQSVYLHDIVYFNAGATVVGDAPIQTVSWSFGAGSAQAETSYSVPGTYIESVTVTDTNGLLSTDQVSVTVRAPDQFEKAFEQVYIESSDQGLTRQPMALTGNNQWEIRVTTVTASQAFYFDMSFDGSNHYGDTQADKVIEKNGAAIVLDQGAGEYIIRLNDTTLGYVAYKDIGPQAPIAVAGADTTQRFGTTVQFNATQSYDIDGTIESYSWSNGLTGPTPSMTYHNAGVYDVVLTVTDNDGLASTDTRTITILANQLPVADAGTAMTARVGTVFQFDASDSMDVDGSIVDYSWSNGLVGRTPSLRYDASGTYNVVLTVTDNDGGQHVDTVTVTVLANQAPTARAGNDVTVKAGVAVNFDGSTSYDSDGSIVSYTWSNGLQGVNPQFNYEEAGTYTVILTVVDNEGATGQDEMVVTVLPNEKPVANAGADRSLKLTDTVALDASLSHDPDGTIVTYRWMSTAFVGDAYLDGQHVTAQFETIGTHEVLLEVIDNYGDTATDTVIITVVENFPPVAQAGEDITVYLDAVVEFDGSASLDNDGTIVSYTWHTGVANQAVLNGQIVTYVYDTLGDYTATLTIEDENGATSTDTRIVSVIEAPISYEKNFEKVYFRGTPNAWGATLMVQVDDYVWETTQVFTAATTERFKFDLWGDWKTNYGDTNADGTLEASGKDILITQGAGEYIIRLNDQTKTYTVEKYIGPQPPVAHAGADQTIRFGETVMFDASASTDADGYIVNYEWDNGLEFIAASLAYPIPGIYTVMLTVTDDTGLTDTDTMVITVTANQLPIANAGADQTIKVGQAVTYNATASSDADGSIVTYEWSNGLSGKTPSWVYQEAGFYTIMLTVMDNDGGIATDEMRVTVNASQAPIAHAGADLVSKVGQTILLNASVSSDSDGQIVSYVWSNGLIGVNPTAVFDAPGVYPIMLTVTDDDGLTATDTVTVTVFANTLPVANAGQDITIHAGQMVTFNGSASSDSDGQIVSYTWNTGEANGPALNGAIVGYTYDVQGVYSATLSVTDNDGGIAVDSVIVTVEEALKNFDKEFAQVYLRGSFNGWGTLGMNLVDDNVWEIMVAFEGGSDKNGADRFKFDVNGDWSLNYGDSNADGVLNKSGSDIRITEGAGDYIIKLNDRYKTYTVEKYVGPQAPTVVLKIGDTLIKDGDTLSLEMNRTWLLDASTSTDDSQIIAFNWSTGFEGALYDYYVEEGEQTLTLILDDDENLRAELTFTVIGMPNIAPTAVINAPTTIIIDETVLFSADKSTDPEGDALSYQWQIAEMTFDTMNVEFAFTTFGTQIVTLTVTDIQGNASTAQVSIDVIEQVDYQFTFDQVYFRGEPNSWKTTPMTLIADNLWAVTVTFGSGSEAGRFKFDIYGNWSHNFGDNNRDGWADSNGANIYIKQGAGTYRIEFNDKTKGYKMIKL